MAAPNCCRDYARCKTKTRWHSVDAQFTMSVSTICYHFISHSISSVSCLQSLAYASRLTNWVLGSGVCIYTYLGGTASISKAFASSLTPGVTGGILGGCGLSSGVSCLSRPGGGGPMPLHLQHVCGFCAVTLWLGKQPSVGFSPNIARCLTIACFIFLWPGTLLPASSLLRLEC